jgi:hypothetical protein
MLQGTWVLPSNGDCLPFKLKHAAMVKVSELSVRVGMQSGLRISSRSGKGGVELGSVRFGCARACEDLTPGGLLSLLVTLVLEGRIVQTPGIDLPTPATFRANKHASGPKAQLYLHLGNTTSCNLASSGAL